ncbi:MAG TPA: DUF4097 family beta strand repeat-containing protein [Thermoanaerobaculia bacterium]|nr:DUF4097 family beta strand repeat-containing protein [Thermoanaerobaculia bacterium]
MHNDRSATVRRAWPVAGIQRLAIHEVDGSVTVEAAPMQEITLVAEAHGDLEPKKGAENEGLFETTIDGDTLSVGRHEKREFHFFWDRPQTRIDYTIKVPPSVSLEVKTVNGRIATRGSDAQSAYVTVNGTIDVETSGRNGFSAKTVNGKVRAKFTQAFNGASMKTVNGGVEAFLPQTASFSVDLAQVNGDFEASFPLSIHSHPGSRRVSGDINGGAHELKIVTVNGDIELMRLAEASPRM